MPDSIHKQRLALARAALLALATLVSEGEMGRNLSPPDRA
jgi:hypothetical protein